MYTHTGQTQGRPLWQEACAGGGRTFGGGDEARVRQAARRSCGECTRATLAPASSASVLS